MTPCPNCLGDARVADVRRLAGKGITRRRYHCLSCDYRWTEAEQTGEAVPAQRRELTDEVLIEILTSLDSNNDVSARTGVDRSTVSAIRLGKIHAKRLPDLPRWQAATCEHCHQWEHGRCLLGLMDPIRSGISFARHCSYFQEAR